MELLKELKDAPPPPPPPEPSKRTSAGRRPFTKLYTSFKAFRTQAEATREEGVVEGSSGSEGPGCPQELHVPFLYP